jgi:hypothetical protein
MKKLSPLFSFISPPPKNHHALFQAAQLWEGSTSPAHLSPSRGATKLRWWGVSK